MQRTAVAALPQNPVTDILCLALSVYQLVLIVRILSSWFPISPSSPASGFFSFLYRITEPVLAPARRLIPPIGGVLDISPMLVFLAIIVVQTAVLGCRARIL